jgi:hypothetical protein
LGLIQSIQQGLLLLHSSTSTLKTRTKKREGGGEFGFETSFTNNTQQRNKEMKRKKKTQQNYGELSTKRAFGFSTQLSECL